ncbi:MAG: beta-aspartyl-peptidase [Flavobacteriales bacterium]|nr:beta-aspartyl-peptidase [Flavobacteriales bacterium]|tara:strand:- start:29120 stop:30100 length:981 start_codon:yes stop_codon:yes gene_type:complete
MNKFALLLILSLAIFACQTTAQKDKPNNKKELVYGLAIHGGAGNLVKGKISDSLEQAYLAKLKEATEVGYAVLESNGSSLDAVVAAIEILENSPLFNAGKGAVFTHEGKNELDASIMNGSNLQAGAVAGVSRIKNPIKAARAVMEKSKHVMLSGKGAEEFAASVGLDTVSPTYFFTQKRFESLQRAISAEKHGTVGVVCLDKKGNLAAGTSTGGMTNKKFGRIGDSPIIGAGTYADENCAVSCTGHGEYFIRYAVAYDVAAQIKYAQKSLKQATEEIINTKLKNAGGSGGLIAMDKDGNISMPFNTSGMFRAFKTNQKETQAFIFD